MTHTRLLLFTSLLLVVLLAACAPAATPTPAPAPAATAVPPAESSPQPPDEGVALDVRTFRLDPARSQASYTAEEEFFNEAVGRLGKALGLANAVGVTNALQGEFAVSPFTPPQVVSGQFQVDISTLKSDDNRRDNRIRQRWLESSRYPSAAFVPTGIQDFPADAAEGQPFSFKLAGDMTIRQVTKPVVFDVTATLQGNELTGVAQAELLMTDFGFEPPDMPGLLKVKDAVTVKLEFTAVEAGG
ncbi:MAG: YceI family protein [Caldilineales bacterium]|nr:YceI family protein [Caldilineales bacterium]